MTTRTSHQIAAPWWGARHMLHRTGERSPVPAPEPRFRVRGGTSAELVLLVHLAAWALLWGLFLVAVA